ncbi:MAG: hypothetical protein M3R24_13800 [Chloroflexota bacterium]|nr:hypothetical protein [Chloroflexota bacterium]PLS78684.1 MAG: hypothetical protein CYG59_17230 [Chloroflexota bacterium]
MSIAHESVFRYERTGLVFLVYRDRVEVLQAQDLATATAVYAIADIAQVDLIEEPGIVRITLHDGTQHQCQLAGNAAAARDAIIRLL